MVDFANTRTYYHADTDTNYFLGQIRH